MGHPQLELQEAWSQAVSVVGLCLDKVPVHQKAGFMGK